VFSPDLNDHGFRKYARRPETWAWGARCSLAVAEVLLRHENSLVFRPANVAARTEELAGCSRAANLHAGLAIEQAIKAVMIHRDPSLILEDASLDKKRFPKRHSLVQPAQDLGLSLTARETEMLMKLENAVQWAGKYVVPLNYRPLTDQNLRSLLSTRYLDELDLVRGLVRRILSLIPLSDA
jgi:hypothetical protein